MAVRAAAEGLLSSMVKEAHAEVGLERRGKEITEDRHHLTVMATTLAAVVVAQVVQAEMQVMLLLVAEAQQLLPFLDWRQLQHLVSAEHLQVVVAAAAAAGATAVAAEAVPVQAASMHGVVPQVVTQDQAVAVVEDGVAAAVTAVLESSLFATQGRR